MPSRQYLLTGRFSSGMWQKIRQDPALPLTVIQDAGQGCGVDVDHYFYAQDDHDFYSVLNATDPAHIWMLRNRLMARGDFGTLYAEPLYVFSDLIDGLGART